MDSTSWDARYAAAERTHLLRPQGDRQAVDILLHTQPWDPDLGEPATAAAYEG